MKRIISIILICISVSLCGCGNKIYSEQAKKDIEVALQNKYGFEVELTTLEYKKKHYQAPNFASDNENVGYVEPHYYFEGQLVGYMKPADFAHKERPYTFDGEVFDMENYTDIKSYTLETYMNSGLK